MMLRNVDAVKKIVEPFLDIFMLVLGVAAAISLWHGDHIDAVIILVIIAISAIIFYIQRFSTDRVLRSLSKRSVQKVDVLRGNHTARVDASQLVPGDIITLAEGEKIPADIRLLRTSNLRVDESQLTGESLPISKKPDVLEGHKELYEQTNMLFQGSFIISGTGTGAVAPTGAGGAGGARGGGRVFCVDGRHFLAGALRRRVFPAQCA